MTEKLILQLVNVSKVYHGPGQEDVLAVKDINIGVVDKPGTGEFICFVGPSGCGKSTILKMIAGLDLPTTGEVLVAGQKVMGPGRDRGLVFQQYTSFDWLTVVENIEFGLKLQGVKAEERRRNALDLVQKVGLDGFEHSYPKNLSGGMKQRVAIARTLANNPRVLLMDEPFGALDAQTRWSMQLFLTEIWHKIDNTIVFVTHDVSEAIFLAERIFVFSARPGTILKEIVVPFPPPRTQELKSDPEFIRIQEEILSLLKAAEGTGQVRITV